LWKSENSDEGLTKVDTHEVSISTFVNPINFIEEIVTKKIFAVSNAIRLNLPQAETTRRT
jgi:hypothetical protein